MADNDEVSGAPDRDETPAEETRPVLPPDPAAQTAAARSAPAPVLKTRWRDRAWTFQAMVAVAAASLVIGGVAGGVIVAASDGDDDGQYQMGPWGPGGGMPPGWQRHGQKWRWKDGPRTPMMTPFGDGDGTTPETPAPTPSPGSTG